MTRTGSTLTPKCATCTFAPRAHDLFVKLSEKMNAANVHKIRQMLQILQCSEGECANCQMYVTTYELLLRKL